MATEELGSINAQGSRVYLITQASLDKLIAAIQMQKLIPGDGVALDETPQGIVVKLNNPTTNA